MVEIGVVLGLAGLVVAYFILGLVANVVATVIPDRWEANLGELYQSKKWTKDPTKR